ncbi:MAG: type II toxin-antitoxin system HicA family toxin [Chloroflexota bacterium]|nr:type II toxin-antitoxin system HicA family toxin [Chloroflexota bacterium]
MGFEERIRGGHHIFETPDLPEVVTLQPMGRDAKAYQVRQLRKLFIQHELFKLLEDE